MEDPTTIAMNLTFFGTLGVGLVMFVGVFLAFVITLLIAGLGRLLATVAMGLFHGAKRLRAPKAARPAKPAKPVRKEPQLSRDWAAAVESANARAATRAKAEAAPEIKVSVRELPSPKAPAQQIRQVGPLVESATDRNGAPTPAPRAFTKPPVPAKSPVLDTGSLATLKNRPAQKGQRKSPRQNTDRKAS
ncbi:hypothetical protein [uncultured Arthrobacter sp.]|uniref:hypothetical protein n=1 Tax=uncultured Arthrobacter sp. TaxID=114050 RepID=UPI0032163223